MIRFARNTLCGVSHNLAPWERRTMAAAAAVQPMRPPFSPVRRRSPSPPTPPCRLTMFDSHSCTFASFPDTTRLKLPTLDDFSPPHAPVVAQEQKALHEEYSYDWLLSVNNDGLHDIAAGLFDDFVDLEKDDVVLNHGKAHEDDDDWMATSAPEELQDLTAHLLFDCTVLTKDAIVQESKHDNQVNDFQVEDKNDAPVPDTIVSSAVAMTVSLAGQIKDSALLFAIQRYGIDHDFTLDVLVVDLDIPDPEANDTQPKYMRECHLDSAGTLFGVVAANDRH